MPLGDSFPEKFKEEFSERSTKIGSVIKILDKDAKPQPKEKRFIIIAETSDSIALGALYINTDINVNVLRTERLKNLQIPLLADTRSYLEWDSWVDCSKIKKFPKTEIANYLKENSGKYLGEVSDEDLKKLIKTVVNATTIDLLQKRNWRLV
jgi:hypothetical protein